MNDLTHVFMIISMSSQSTLGDSNQLQLEYACCTKHQICSKSIKFWSADDSFYARADMGRGADAAGQSP